MLSFISFPPSRDILNIMKFLEALQRVYVIFDKRAIRKDTYLFDRRLMVKIME